MTECRFLISRYSWILINFQKRLHLYGHCLGEFALLLQLFVFIIKRVEKLFGWTFKLCCWYRAWLYWLFALSVGWIKEAFGIFLKVNLFVWIVDSWFLDILKRKFSLWAEALTILWFHIELVIFNANLKRFVFLLKEVNCRYQLTFCLDLLSL